MAESTRRLSFQMLCVSSALAMVCVLSGCSRPATNKTQGYVEGEFVYVACPSSGAVQNLYVQRGQSVKAGDPLFALEDAFQTAACDEAGRQLAQAKADLEDAKKGKRPTEMQSMQAQLAQAQASLSFSETELARQEKLAAAHAGMAQDLDRARSNRDQDSHRVAQLEADLETAQLGLRSDQVVAAEQEVAAKAAALAQAQWNLSQRKQSAPQDGLIFDTLYRQGEWVTAEHPIISLLPPQNVKLRAFVSEMQVGSIKLGQSVQVTVDGVAEPLVGKVSFISPQAEYTPPVIYSQESRSKLVYMIEAVFDPATAMQLHPGQPVDVQFVP
jgi:HlyD family secretion protein